MLRGALYERIGEPVKARQAYERFLELWRDGEAPLEPQLRTAREAVARLRDAAPRSMGTSGGARGGASGAPGR